MTKTWDDVEKTIRYCFKHGGCSVAGPHVQASNSKYANQFTEEVLINETRTAFYQMMGGIKKALLKIFDYPIYQLPPGMIEVYGIDKKGYKHIGIEINRDEVLSLIPKEICNQSTKK